MSNTAFEQAFACPDQSPPVLGPSSDNIDENFSTLLTDLAKDGINYNSPTKKMAKGKMEKGSGSSMHKIPEKKKASPEKKKAKKTRITRSTPTRTKTPTFMGNSDYNTEEKIHS